MLKRAPTVPPFPQFKTRSRQVGALFRRFVLPHYRGLHAGRKRRAPISKVFGSNFRSLADTSGLLFVFVSYHSNKENSTFVKFEVKILRDKMPKRNAAPLWRISSDEDER